MLPSQVLVIIMTFPVAFSVGALRIGIIGGGLSGTSTAYFLKELLGEDVTVDVYESGPIGGRLATVLIDGEEYETGGSIIHRRNKYASTLASKFNLTERAELKDQVLGLYGRQGFVFTESEYSWLNPLKYLYRYGYGIVKLSQYLELLLKKFDRIYQLQETNAYKSVQDLLEAIDPSFLQYTSVSTQNGFLKEGFSERIISELVHATIRCNYGQSTAVHQFVGSVSCAGAGAELFAIEGGNKQLPEKLLEASLARLYREKVQSVVLNEASKFIINTPTKQTTYDIVVVSTPLTRNTNNIQFKGFPKEIEVPGRYHLTVCTIVKGKPNHAFFGYDNPESVPDMILTVSDNLFFNSLGKISPVSSSNVSKKYVKYSIWKVFSRNTLSDDNLSKLFSEYSVEAVIDWLAYPHYDAVRRYDSFILNRNLYYTNAMEWSASSMETSIIGAKNVALLIHHSLNKNVPNSAAEGVHLAHGEL